jgi:anti-anti-sigma regulatory factor
MAYSSYKTIVSQEIQRFMTNLDIKERQDGDVTVLDMNGDIKIDGGNVAYRRTIHRLLEEGRRKILLNLKGVSDIDSSGCCSSSP